MIVLDELPIGELKRTDLRNIITMLEDYIIEGNYYGRKDYWDVSIVRIQQWMDYIEDIAYSTDVKCVGEYR